MPTYRKLVFIVKLCHCHNIIADRNYSGDVFRIHYLCVKQISAICHLLYDAGAIVVGYLSPTRTDEGRLGRGTLLCEYQKCTR